METGKGHNQHKSVLAGNESCDTGKDCSSEVGEDSLTDVESGNACGGEPGSVPPPSPPSPPAPTPPPSQARQTAEFAQLEKLASWFHLDRQTPVTLALVTANITTFFIMMCCSGMETLFVPRVDTLLNWGALYAPSTLDGQYWRMLTSLFLHAGVLHLALNVYVLCYVGPLVERLFGSWKFLAIYFLAGLGGSVATLMFNPTAVGVGASGAIFGICGGLLAFYQARKSDFPPQLFREKTTALLVFLLINIVVGFVQPNIGNAAHIGGLAIGFWVAHAVMPCDPNDWHWHWRDSLRVLAVVLTLAVAFHFDLLGTFDIGGELSLVRGVELLKSGQYRQALALLDRRVKLDPNDPRAYVARSAAHEMLSEHAKAVEDCDKILQIDPKNVGALITRANSYGKLGELQRSIEDSKKALALQPKAAGAYAVRGWDYLALGQYRLAISDYLTAVHMRPELKFVYLSVAYARFAIGDIDGAVAAARKFLATAGWRDESAPYAVIVSALSLRAAGEEKAAESVLDEGLSHVNRSLWSARLIEYLRGQLSAEKLEASAVDNDKKTEAKTYIGLTLAQSGNRKEARRYFEWVAQHGNKEFYEYLLARTALEKSPDKTEDRSGSKPVGQ